MAVKVAAPWSTFPIPKAVMFALKVTAVPVALRSEPFDTTGRVVEVVVKVWDELAQTPSIAAEFYARMR